MTDWRATLHKTRQSAFSHWTDRLRQRQIDPETWEALEAALIQADLGVALAQEVLQAARQQADQQQARHPQDLLPILRQQLLARLPAGVTPVLPPPPAVFLLVGVNGAGKTTCCAKLAHHWKRQGMDVMLAGADTYRAAAADQLNSWATRLGLEMVSAPPGSDPASVVYRACEAALRRPAQVLLADTSGRMHTSHNLMQELEKLARVASKVVPGAPHEVYLVLDATTGQNGLQQASAFQAKVGVTSLIVAKLDQSSKGGSALAASRTLHLPIAYVGTGEGLEDFAPFDPLPFVEGLLPTEPSEPPDGL